MKLLKPLLKMGISCCALCAATLLSAQQMPADQPIPLDPQVRYGKLSNGLTYYIRKNTYQPKVADFYIAQKVGSILEKPSQRGLAHFLEHMAFNGSKHFPGGDKGPSIVPWCESIGIRYGNNLNAYTSVDETVYNICDVPVLREGIIDSCLYILRDWSNDLLLTDTEIDKERGVIEEEWRSRQNATMRIYEQIEKKVYKGCKYEDCLPIGNMDVVRHFPYKELRDYYKEWYRPDLQAIIVVGDVDPDRMEQKIKQLFADIPMPSPASERIYYPVPDNKEPIVGIFTDKEETTTQVQLFFKHDPIPWEQRETLGAWKRYFENNMIDQIIDERMYEILQRADAPLLSYMTGDGDFLFSATKQAFTLIAQAKENQASQAIACLYREVLRAARGGFTASEVERAKMRLLSEYESYYKEREHTKNGNYVQSYVTHFLTRNVTPGIEYEYTELIRKVIPQITADELVSLLRSYLTPENRVLLLTSPEKDGLTYPTEQELLKAVTDVEAEQLEPYTDRIGNEPLIAQLPTPGKVVEQAPDSFGFTRLKLSNGMNVYVKPTDFNADDVRFSMIRDGGTSAFPESDIDQWRYATDIAEVGGLGTYSPQDLQKKLAGKQVSINTSGTTYTNQITGSCSPKDFETLLQLVYLQCTAPRKDEEALQAWKNSEKEDIRNADLQPETAFTDSIRHTVYTPSPRIEQPKEADIDAIDYDKSLNYFHALFDDASDFSAFIVGNVQIDSIRPYLEQYLAALPSDYTEETWQPISTKWRTGQNIKHFDRKLETPKEYIFISYNKPMPITLRDGLKIQMLSRILSIVYNETLREQEGGTYGASVYEENEPIPEPRLALTIYLNTDSSKLRRLMPLIRQGIEQLMQSGPQEEDLNKVKEYQLKSHQQRVRDNNYWLSQFATLKLYGINGVSGYEEAVKSITAEELKEFARTFFSGSNYYETIMSPAPQGKEP